MEFSNWIIVKPIVSSPNCRRPETDKHGEGDDEKELFFQQFSRLTMVNIQVHHVLMSWGSWFVDFDQW